MAQNFIFIMTEGTHDAAFLYRILQHNGFEPKRIKIKDYPSPLNGLFQGGVSLVPLSDLGLDNNYNSGFLPREVLCKADCWVSILSFGGDEQRVKRRDFINSVLNFQSPNDDEIQIPGNYSILFFLDADDKGVEKRLQKIEGEVQMCFPENYAVEIVNCHVTNLERIRFGAFIFTASGENTGRLEDILIHLMKAGNEKIFNHAEEFLQQYKNGNGKYDTSKAVIGTVAQLQVPGASSSVYIKKTSYLREEVVKTDKTCCSILNLIEECNTH